MPHIEQDTSRAEVRMATRLAMANRDLLEADSYLHALNDLPLESEREKDGKLVKRALMSSAIISYAKSFGGNRGAEIADRNIDVASFACVNKEHHEKLLYLRNRVIAHSDAEVVPAQIIDHSYENMLIVATPVFDILEEIDPEIMKEQITVLLEQIQEKLHMYSEQLRAIPRVLGSKMRIDINDESPKK